MSGRTGAHLSIENGARPMTTNASAISVSMPRDCSSPVPAIEFLAASLSRSLSSPSMKNSSGTLSISDSRVIGIRNAFLRIGG